MANALFVAYYRVSTARQGRSGLGLDAQRAAVAAYLNGGDWSLIGEFTEVESGKVNDRTQLAAAMQQCRLTSAKLVIAKLDRLSRNASFLLSLRDGGVEFVAADMPDANRMTVGIMAVIAEHEREMISARTKAALQAAKARGTALGGYREGNRVDGRLGVAARQKAAAAFAARVAPMVAGMRQRGLSLRQIAVELRAQHVSAPSGGTWTATAVSRTLARVP